MAENKLAGRPRTRTDARHVNIIIENSIIDKVDKVSKALGITKRSLWEKALTEYCDRHKEAIDTLARAQELKKTI